MATALSFLITKHYDRKDRLEAGPKEKCQLHEFI